MGNALDDAAAKGLSEIWGLPLRVATAVRQGANGKTAKAAPKQRSK